MVWQRKGVIEKDYSSQVAEREIQINKHNRCSKTDI